MLVDGGDCLSDMAVLRNQPGLFATVALDPTAWRTVTGMSFDAFTGCGRGAAAARARVWAVGRLPGTITSDFDASLVTAHSEKQDAKPTYKRGFGCHPLLCVLDETGEALAAINRPGNAGANVPLPTLPSSTPPWPSCRCRRARECRCRPRRLGRRHPQVPSTGCGPARGIPLLGRARPDRPRA